MIHYKIVTNIYKKREEEWVEYMMEKHIPQIINTDYFKNFSFNKTTLIETNDHINPDFHRYEIVFKKEQKPEARRNSGINYIYKAV